MKIGEARMVSDAGTPLVKPQYRTTVPLQGASLEWWLTLPACQGARKLIEAGLPPDAILRITRNGAPIFEDRTIAQWADTTVIENTNSTARFAQYKAFDMKENEE